MALDDFPSEDVFTPSGGVEALQSGLENEAAAQRAELDTDAAGKAAARMRKSVVRAPAAPGVPQIQDDAGFEALAPGAMFIDPEGQKRQKPYTVTSDPDYARVPEGMQFLDPEGALRQKPKFEGIDFTAQALYDMALTPAEKRKILERSYPGKVREDAEGLFVEDEGAFRRPGRGDVIGKRGAAFAAGAAAPVVSSVLGTIGGGVAGLPGGPAGAFVGGMAGGGSGAALGQFFNDMVLQLAGVYDRTPGEAAGNIALAGATGAMGGGVGRGIATAVPTLREGISHATTAMPSIAAKFLGASAPDVTMARELAEKGVAVPPSAWAKEAPHLQNVVEVFDPAFRTQQPLKESATGYYEQTAGRILKDMGVEPQASIIKPEAAVPTQKAGETIMARTLRESQEADAWYSAALEQRKFEASQGLPAATAQREALTTAAEQSRAAAQRLIDEGFKDIAAETESAFKIAKAGASGGDLWQGVGSKLVALRRGIGERANKMYSDADVLAGNNLPNAQGLPEMAREFLDGLPGDFQSKYPDIVRKMRDLAGTVDEATGEVIKEPVTPTFGQLHNLRSQLRSNVDWYDLTPDMREGTYKFFSRKVDEVLHDKHAVPELKAAADALDKADQFYAENIKVFNANQIKTIMRGLQAGEPADPANLYRAIAKEGHTDLVAKIRDMVGPNLWAGVKAADVDAMMRAARQLDDTIDGRTFAKEVLDRYQRGLLQTVHGSEAAAKLRDQALAIERLEGRLKIPAQPGDTVTTVIARARMAADEAKAAADKDPLGLLRRETAQIVRDHRAQISKLREERRSDPLGFLYEPTTGAAEAVERILKNEDMILAAANRFGEKSAEFNLLRQIYAQRILQGTMQPGKRLEGVTPEVQAMMFPGLSLPQMQTLAREMDFLLGRQTLRRGTAQGMSAMSKVENPITNIKGLRGAAKMLPGLNPLARAARTQYYALITKIMTSPATLRFIEKGLTGTAEQQAAVREILRAHLQRGGAMGAGGAEAMFQAGEGQSSAGQQ